METKIKPVGSIFRVMNGCIIVGSIWGLNKKELKEWLNKKRMPFTDVITLA